MKSSLPQISIVTAALNSADTIEDCLASVKRQIYPAQHVVMDGASRDETTSIAGKFLTADDMLVSEKDEGMYDAINKGIALCTGDVIGTLNADDFYPHERVLSLVVEQFQDPEVDACYGDLVYVDREDVSIVRRFWKSRPYLENMFLKGWMPPHPTFFVRRHVYEKYGGLRLDCGSAADYELLLRLFEKQRIRTRYIPSLLVVMRAGGMSNLSLKSRWKANKMDRYAWKVNELGKPRWATVLKPISKLNQFVRGGVGNKAWLAEGWPREAGVRSHHAKVPRPVPPGGGEKRPYRNLSSQGEGEQQDQCHEPMGTPSRQTSTREADSLPLYAVTVNYHSEAHLCRLVASLSTVPRLKELIIIDHSATLVREALSHTLPMRVIRAPNRGYGAGLNAGMRQIRDRDAIVLLCNPDIELLHPARLSEVIKTFRENSRLAVVAPAVLNPKLQRTHSCRRFYSWGSALVARLPYFRNHPERYRWRYFCMEKNLHESFDVEWCSGSAMFLRLSFFPVPLVFDERFFLYFEDVDLCAQIHKNGLLVRYLPEPMCIHFENRESAESFPFLVLHMKSMLQFIIKHRGLPSAEKLRQAGARS